MIVIWKGHGLLIPIFPFIGARLFGASFDWLIAHVDSTVLTSFKFATWAWGTVVGIWFYGRFIGKTTERHVIDPKTQETLVVKNSHTFYGVGPMDWVKLAALVAVVITVICFLGYRATSQASKTSEPPHRLAAVHGYLPNV